MLVDGIYVLIIGKYIGPDKPGPWSSIFSSMGIDVFTLGPLFILYGLLWLAWVFSVCKNTNKARIFGILLSILTLWYLPIGTLFSSIILIVLVIMNRKVYQP